MVFNDAMHTVIMQSSILIKHSCVPTVNKTYHLPSIGDKNNDMAIIGFVKMELLEQEACDLYADFIHDWATHVFPQTKGDHVDTIPLHVSLAQHATCTSPSTQEACILTHHLLLLLLWVTSTPVHGQSCDKNMLQLYMELYHPLDLR